MYLLGYLLISTILAPVLCIFNEDLNKQNFTGAKNQFLGDPCDNLGVLLYEDLGCTPQYNDTSLCPIKYNCEGLEESSDFCYFRGRPYKNLENIEEELLNPSCDRNCFCSVEGGKSKFICAVLDCPEWLGVENKRSCYRKYSLDQCCSVGEVCPPFQNDVKCLVDGTEYKEGQQFYPKNTCNVCVCQKGFTGKFEKPFCGKWRCGVQLKNSVEIREGCAPWYDDKNVLCCPFKWICPDGSEDITGVATSDDVCRYGEKTLKVGQAFERYNVDDGFGKIIQKVKCECVIPPLLTCVDA